MQEETVHIRITEKDGLWDLWAAQTTDIAAPPLYTARRRTPQQLTELVRFILGEAAAPEPIKAAPTHKGPRKMAAHQAPWPPAHQALWALLCTLDGWIEGAQEDHEAMGHRGENTGEECWRSFAPADIRSMVNDTARQLGISEFSTPQPAREDVKLP
jgi:hypothetical protein